MTEPSDDFRDRSLFVAGPVFLVALGLLFLLMLAVLAIFGAVSAPVGWLFFAAGAFLLAAGLLWGVAVSRARWPHEGA